MLTELGDVALHHQIETRCGPHLLMGTLYRPPKLLRLSWSACRQDLLPQQAPLGSDNPHTGDLDTQYCSTTTQ
jgi:hypothetical protein